MLPTSSKDAFEKLSFTTLLVFYLFFCGSLYLVGFWLQFDVNVLPLITTLDIPKSFVQPFSNMKFLMFTVLFFLYLGRYELLSKEKLIGFGIYLVITLLLIFFYKTGDVQSRIIDFATSFLFAILTGLESFRMENVNFKKYLPQLKQLLLIYPIACLASGYIEADNIRTNKKNAIVENLLKPTKEYSEVIGKKLIGYVGENVVFSSIDNNHYYVVSRTTLSTIRFYAVKE